MGQEQSFRKKEEVSRKDNKGKAHIAIYNAERSGAYISQYHPLSITTTSASFYCS
jgi:hypothetical protein